MQLLGVALGDLEIFLGLQDLSDLSKQAKQLHRDFACTRVFGLCGLPALTARRTSISDVLETIPSWL